MAAGRRPNARGWGQPGLADRRLPGRRVNQRELAELAGVGLGTVRDLEQGRSPRSRSLSRMAAALSLDPAQIRASACAALGARATVAAGCRPGQRTGERVVSGWRCSGHWRRGVAASGSAWVR